MKISLLLTALAGNYEIKASWSVYQRLHQGLLLALGQWQTCQHLIPLQNQIITIGHQVIEHGSKASLVPKRSWQKK
jgi:hypothetical protein